MKNVLSIEASIGAAGWRESAGTDSVEAVKPGVPCCVEFELCEFLPVSAVPGG